MAMSYSSLDKGGKYAGHIVYVEVPGGLPSGDRRRQAFTSSPDLGCRKF